MKVHVLSVAVYMGTVSSPCPVALIIKALVRRSPISFLAELFLIILYIQNLAPLLNKCIVFFLFHFQ